MYKAKQTYYEDSLVRSISNGVKSEKFSEKASLCYVRFIPMGLHAYLGSTGNQAHGFSPVENLVLQNMKLYLFYFQEACPALHLQRMYILCIC